MREMRSSTVMPLPLDSVLRFTGAPRVRRETARGRAELVTLVWAVLLNLMLFGGFLALATPVFETNDDLGMQTIASGFYGGHPDPHLIFSNVLVGWFLCLCYRMTNSLNWYWLYLVTVHFVSLTAISWVVLNRKRSWVSVLWLVAFFLVAETRVLLLLQFTTTAFLAGIAGLLLVVDGLDPARPVEWRKVVGGILLITLMGLIRDAVVWLLVLIAMPFLVERFGWRGRFRLASAGFVCLVIFLAGWQLNRWYYQRDPAWAEFREYNQLRGEIQKTRLEYYAKEAAPAAGWTANDGSMFVDFFLSDPEVYGATSRLRAFTTELRRLDKLEAHRHVKFRLYLPSYFGGTPGLMMNLALIAAFWVVVTARRNRIRYLAALGAMYAILLVLSYYLLSTSRLPERVACCFPVLTLAICLYWVTVDRPKEESAKVSREEMSLRLSWRPKWIWARAVLVGLTVFSCALLLGWQARALWRLDRWNRGLKSASRIVFAPVRTLLPGGQKPVLVAMPYDSVLERSLVFNSNPSDLPFTLIPYGWLSHSPLYRQLLEDCRLKPFAMSLLTRPDVFFLMEKRWMDRLRVFYREHYRQEIEFVSVLDSDAMPGYRECELHLYKAQVIRSTLTERPSL